MWFNIKNHYIIYMSYLNNIYIIAIGILYVLYFLNWFNLWHEAPEYLYEYNLYFQTAIAVIIIIIFNPVYKFKITDIHRKIAFSCGFFLFTNIGLNTLLTNVTMIRNKIRNIKH
jgi:hypothetical protein